MDLFNGFLLEINERNILLVECIEVDERANVFIYPFAGRLVHEGLAALFAIPFMQAYPVIAWLCWVPNLILAEMYLRTR